MKLEAKIKRYDIAYGEELISLLKFKEYTVSLSEQIEKLQLQLKKVEREESSASAAKAPGPALA